MIGKVNQAKLAPTLQGIMAQSSTYGSAIPYLFGTTMMSPLLIWLNGIRKGDSAKKGSKKGGVPTYRACCDFLLGHNPIQHVFRVIASNVGLGLRSNVINGVSGPSHNITDTNFYHVVGVTKTVSYSFAVNDYGGFAGTLSGSYEVPCWNMALQGPDPTNSFGYKYTPFTYYWVPGTTIVSQLIGSGFNIYYAGSVLHGWGAGQIPLPYVLNAAFEPSLGESEAYTGYLDFTDQRIIYPWFAGFGSFNFDIGMGAAPQIRTEAIGGCTLYPDPRSNSPQPAADADFADMVEAIFKMGQTQAALFANNVGTPTAASPVQPGVSCWEFPGAVQKKFWAQAVQGNFTGSIQYDLPITQGNILVVTAASNSTGSFGISDTGGNAWTPVINSNGAAFWYTQVVASGPCTINLTGVPSSADVMIYEIGGNDTVDAVASNFAILNSPPTCNIASSITGGQTGYILTWVFPDVIGTTGSGDYLNWNQLIAAVNQGGNFYASGTSISYTQYRQVRAPGTYTFTGDKSTSSWRVVMLALKNSVAPTYPKPFGNILDAASLDSCRKQCRANGLWGSLNMNNQQKASSWLEDIYLCMDAAPVWSGFKLKSIPWSEVSTAGNGAKYTAPTAAGPVASLTVSDSISQSGESWISIDRKSTVDRPDLLRIEHPDRNNNYNKSVVSQPDPGGLTLFGLRYGSPKVLPMVQHTAVARMVLGYMVRRQNYLPRTYKFKLQAKWKLLEAMDLVTITDPLLGLDTFPVRLTAVTENEDYSLDCEAQDYVYGLNAPNPLLVTSNQSSSGSTSTVPLPVNAPIFFEPPGAMTGDPNDELWINISDSDPLYGGSVVYASVDNGNTYVQIGIINGNGTTGFTMADWPQALDPDTTNDLFVDLSECAGVLPQLTAQQRDNFTNPIYVDGGGGLYPFELGAYDTATLIGPSQYRIVASGTSTPPTPPTPATEDLLDWITMDSRRSSFHLEGTSSLGGRSYGWCYLDPSGNKVWWVKTADGNPWDIQLYDVAFFYHWITENADENAWSNPRAYKRLNTSHGRPTAQGVAVAPRSYTPPTPVTIDTNAPNPMVRTLLCETDGEPVINLPDFRGVTSGPVTVAWGGDVGTQPTITVSVYRGANSTGNYPSLEIFDYVKFVGWVQWRNLQLLSGTYPNGVYKTIQTTRRTDIVAGTPGSPNFPCGFKPGWP